MNREQLIEKATLAMYNGDQRLAERYKGDGRKVVDAILPQVTTVEELEALDERSVVVFEAGTYSLVLRFEKGRLRGDSWVGSLEQAIAELGSLTVVWKP